MNQQVSKEIIAIKALNLLFFNYTEEMIKEMRSIREFNHCWENYINFNEQTYMQIWELYLSKISYKTQILLLEIALKHYGEEATRSFENAVDMSILVQSHINKNKSM